MAGLKKKNCELNISFMSSQRIRVYNRKYFKKDKATDVIAFPAGESIVSNHEARSTKHEFLGDIAISTDRAKHNAKIYGTSFLEETVLYVIHGVLHLLGYEDTSLEKRDLMKAKENEIFQRVKKNLR